MKKNLIILLISILGVIGIIALSTIAANKPKTYMDQLENVSMKIKEGTLTKTGATVIITDTSNADHTYGLEYRIDKMENNEWIPLKMKPEKYGWKLIGYHVDENNQLEMEHDWDFLYGELEEGHYRLVKNMSLPENGEMVTHEFSAEFTIDDTISLSLTEKAM